MAEHYAILKVLGEGSFGKCYLVQAASDNSKRVIKQVDLNPLKKSEHSEALREAKVLEQLDHPNIIRFREVYKTKKNKLCIVMDYADGGDLATKIKSQRSSPFTEDFILNVFVQICLALKHVHDRKVIHRDLKPQNIFLMQSGNAKLGDFGIAKVLSKTMEQARTLVGTPYYLSPEVVEGQPYSFASDIWAIGAVLYEMCALRPPFMAESIHALAIKIIEGRYEPISSRYSSELSSLVTALLVREPANRPSIHQILRFPIVRKRIEDHLSRSLCLEEFSHTILHGFNLLARQPTAPLPSSKPETPSRQGSLSTQADTPQPSASPIAFYSPTDVNTPSPEVQQRVARVIASNRGEVDRQAMIADLRRKRAELRARKRNEDAVALAHPSAVAPSAFNKEEYEAFIYEIQGALIEQEGDSTPQLQAPVCEAEETPGASILEEAEGLRARLQQSLGPEIFANVYNLVRQAEGDTETLLADWMGRKDQETYVPLLKELMRLESS